MVTATASCRCGQLRVGVTGDPVRVSVCHCHDCQQRSGSAFSWQARWPEAQVTITGEATTWRHAGDSGAFATFSFCATCGATVFYTNDTMPGVVAVAVGGLAGKEQPAPWFSVYEDRMQPWLSIAGDEIERHA